MEKVATLLERAEYFRGRALEVRTIARSLADAAARETLRAIAQDYERLADAQDQLILTKSSTVLLEPRRPPPCE